MTEGRFFCHALSLGPVGWAIGAAYQIGDIVTDGYGIDMTDY